MATVKDTLEKQTKRILSAEYAPKRVRIVKDPTATIPTKGTPGSAAYDLYTKSDVTIYPGRQVVPVGLRMVLPLQCQGQVEPKSGMSLNGMVGCDLVSVDDRTKYYVRHKFFFGLFCTLQECFKNKKDTMKRYDADVLVGKVDEDYRGEVGVIIKSMEKKPFIIPQGMPIAQFTIQKVEQADWTQELSLEESIRSDGGFGSTLQ